MTEDRVTHLVGRFFPKPNDPCWTLVACLAQGVLAVVEHCSAGSDRQILKLR